MMKKVYHSDSPNRGGSWPEVDALQAGGGRAEAPASRDRHPRPRLQRRIVNSKEYWKNYLWCGVGLIARWRSTSIERGQRRLIAFPGLAVIIPASF